MLTSALTRLKAFNRNCKLKDAILTFIASQVITQAEERELAQVFFSLDRNGDGRISKTELLAKYGEIVGVVEAEREVSEIMQKIDLDGSGFIDYKEFLKASMEKSKNANKESLDAAFKMFDRDGDGRISAEELRWVLSGGMVQDSSWEDLLREIDANQDGEIDLREFMALVQSSF
jgi:calcium-dependent protein kinase